MRLNAERCQDGLEMRMHLPLLGKYPMLLYVALLAYRTGENEEWYYAGSSEEGMVKERPLTVNACDEEPPAPDNVCCDGE